MKIVKSLKKLGLLIAGVSEKLKIKPKNEKEDFFQCY